MRNLLEYPITTQEATQVLEQLLQTLDPTLVGDVRPSVIRWTISRLDVLEKLENEGGNYSLSVNFVF